MYIEDIPAINHQQTHNPSKCIDSTSTIQFLFQDTRKKKNQTIRFLIFLASAWLAGLGDAKETAAKLLSSATVQLVSESIFQTPKQNYSHSILKYLQSGIKQGCCCIIYHGNSGC